MSLQDWRHLPQRALQSILCPVCGGPMMGLLQVDAWGNRYCARHSNEYPRCTCCQRLICDRLTGGGVAYQDQRLVCNLCRKTAIDTKEQAKPYIEATAAWLYGQGFSFERLALRVELVYRQELSSNSEHRGGGEPFGMIHKSMVGRGRMALRKVDGVAILKGLSRQVMEGVAIHELGHAWLFLHSIDNLDAAVEEGFCNLLSHLYHSGIQTDEARFCMRVIEQDPSPVYGDGFRAVNAAVKWYGLHLSLEYLKQNGRLPP